MRGSVIGSALVHVAILLVVFAVRSSRTVFVAGPDVVQVLLVDPSAMPVTPAPAPPPEPRKREPTPVVPSEDTGVRLGPPKRPPREKTPEEAPPPQEPAVQLPYASVGNTGLRGAVATDDASFEFAYYLTLVRDRIAANWSPPAGLTRGGEPVRAVLYFRIRRDGRVTATRVEAGSGVEFFDRSALRAITISDPLPPLPVGYAGSDLGVHFGFEYLAP